MAKIVTQKRIARAKRCVNKKVGRVVRKTDRVVKRLQARMNRRIKCARAQAVRKVQCYLKRKAAERRKSRSCDEDDFDLLGGKRRVRHAPFSGPKYRELVERVTRRILRDKGTSMSEMRREIRQAKRDAKKRVCCAKKTGRKTVRGKTKLAKKQRRVYRKTLKAGLKAAKEECKQEFVDLPGCKKSAKVMKCRQKKARCARKEARRAARSVDESVDVTTSSDCNDGLVKIMKGLLSGSSGMTATATVDK